MIDEKQIKQWLKEGTITQVQAKKMLADVSKDKSSEKSNNFIAVVAAIGVVLIFIGFAWLIAKNWHQIPNIVKVLILVGSTLAAFVSGVFFRQKNHEGVGRSLITLGALLYILSVFLIAQIYATPSGLQGYAWLLLLCWPVVALTAYFLDSKENLVVSMIAFFPWVVTQYLASVNNGEEGIIFGFVLIFLGAGALLFSLSSLHNSFNHKFTNIYRFWMIFYFLLIFYILSFQSFLPTLSRYSFEGKVFSAFLIFFVIICLLGLVFGAFFAIRKSSRSLKEILGFLGIIVLLFVLVLSTKVGQAGTDLMGTCNVKGCYDFSTESVCASAPASLVCEWKTDQWNPQGYCYQTTCFDFKTEDKCNSTSNNSGCIWRDNSCQQQTWDNTAYEMCSKFNGQKYVCTDNPVCNWQPSGMFFDVLGGLPTSLWLLWILNNFVFIGFIILVLWYGQSIGSTKIVNLGIAAFILEILARYIGFWLDFQGYFAFSVLSISGGLLLILGVWLIPKWRKKLLDKTKLTSNKKG